MSEYLAHFCCLPQVISVLIMRSCSITRNLILCPCFSAARNIRRSSAKSHRLFDCSRTRRQRQTIQKGKLVTPAGAPQLLSPLQRGYLSPQQLELQWVGSKSTQRITHMTYRLWHKTIAFMCPYESCGQKLMS